MAASVFGRIVAHRPDVDDPRARFPEAAQSAAHPMPPGAAEGALAVLQGHAAEADEQLAMFGQHIPRGVGGAPGPARHMRHHHRAGAQAVAVDAERPAADHMVEPAQVALGVMEAAGAGPAVGAAEQGFVAMLLTHAGDLADA
jgi:hypothetical protein